MEFNHLIIPDVASVVGMSVSLLLVLLLRKQTEHDACTKMGVFLGCVIFAIYFGICEKSVCEIYGLAKTDWLFRLGPILMMSFAPFLPSIVLCSWLVSPVLQWRTDFSRTLTAFSFISGAAIWVAYLRVGLQASLTNQRVSQSLALNVLVCFLLALLSVVRLPLDSRLRSFLKVTCSINIFGSIAVVVASLLNATILTRANSVASSFLVLLRLICVLVGLLGSFIAAARFRYIDVFIRWSTRITMLGVLSIFVTLSFTTVAFDVSPPEKGVGFLICAFETILLLLMGIILSEKCERWVESHVLQQADLKTEAARLHASLFTLDRKEDLFTLVEESLARTLDVHEVKVLPRELIPSEVLGLQILREEPVEIPARIAPLSIGGLRNIEVLIPVHSIADIQEMIGVSTGAGRRSLHSGEIRFLHAAGHQLGVRLHLLDMEAASRRQALREALLRQQLTEAELRALRSQVNPHFLFNSLNTIADLIIRNPLNAERMTLRLSSVFRHVLAQADRQFVTIAEEFNFLRDYLDIEQERFGENLSVCFQMDPQVAKILVPTLLLQPLVENALKHGLAPKGGKRSIRIVAAGCQTSVLLEVIDDGIGFPGGSPQVLSSPPRGSGVGLANTRARLRAVYGEAGSLVVESEPLQGSRVSLSLPLQEVIA